ncbi:hypothetical protein T09_8897 [Trichinella sp. T9]|nr:hypothetical protein T09_8897 [Trichinella sp. T9]
MSVTGILQSHNGTPKCLSLLKSAQPSLQSCCKLSYGANERRGELSSGIPPGAAAYHHYVYAAHLLTSVLR